MEDGNERKLALAAGLVEQARQAQLNPGDELHKAQLANQVIIVAMQASTDVLAQVQGMDARLQTLETAVHDKANKQEVEQMMEAQASELQKAQRKMGQDMLRQVKQEANKAMDAKLKTVKNQMKALQAAMKRSGGGGGGGGRGGASGSRAAKKERHEYDAQNYTFIGAGGEEKSMAEASYEDIKELYLLVKAAKDEAGRIKGNATLTKENLKKWGITVQQARVPHNKASNRSIYLTTFLEEGKEKAAAAMLANAELAAVDIAN